MCARFAKRRNRIRGSTQQDDVSPNLPPFPGPMGGWGYSPLLVISRSEEKRRHSLNISAKGESKEAANLSAAQGELSY